jgi:arylsulfatase
MFKRYTYNGGVCDPLVVSWPKGINARGQVRDQYHHVTDIVPTILDCCGIQMPKSVEGIEQTPLVGESMRYTFENSKAPTRRVTQYYEMLGSRGIWHKGWKAVSDHGPFTGLGNFDQDKWLLFHTDEDRSEAHDLAAQHPDKVKQLVALWFEEARKYNVWPLIDYSIEHDLQKILALEYHVPVTPSGKYTYYPATLPIPERSVANTHGVSFKILAEIELTKDSKGVIFAHGSRFGGHSLFIKDDKLTYCYNFLGVPPEQRIIANVPPPGKHIVGVEFTKQTMGKYQEAHGPLKLYIDDKVVAENEIRTMTGHFSLCGEGLCVGYDSGDPVSSEYGPKFEFTEGSVSKVVFDVADDAYVDVARHMQAALARD